MIESNKSNEIKLFKCPICNKIYKLVDKVYVGEIPMSKTESFKYGYYLTDFGDKIYYREYDVCTLNEIPSKDNTYIMSFSETHKIREIYHCLRFVEDNSINCEDWVAEKVFTIKGEPF